MYNNGILRKYVIYFGTLFNEIYLTRENADGDIHQTMKVPLNYGPKEKFLARAQGNPDLNRPIAIQLPRIAFEMKDIRYAPERKLISSGKIARVNPDAPNKMKYTYNPIPYDIFFDLYIMVKNAEDGTRIIENILPYFTPEYTATLNLLPELDLKYDIPVIINNTNLHDSYEGDFISRRAIIWTLSFTMKGYLFGPVREAGIIKEVDVNINIPPTGIGVDEATPENTANTLSITITPGLLANGSPTSNASLSIDKDLITANDNYGYIIEFSENIP